MKRLFLAAALPDSHIEKIENYLQIYKKDQHLEGAKWTKPENYHITVLFLGEVVDAHLPEMKILLRGLAARMAPFTLHFEHTEFFSYKVPKVIWGRFQRSLEFLELHKECEKFMKPYVDLAEEEEMKEPIPHVTLARLRKPVDPKKFSFQPLNLEPFEISEIHLYESDLTSHGSVYARLDTFSLSI